MSATSTPIAGAVKKVFSWEIALSILLIFAGIFAIILPPIAGVGITIFVGWLLIFSGVGHIVYGWQTRQKGTMLWELLLGIVYIGVLSAAWVIGTLVGISMIFSGTARLMISLAARKLVKAVA
jgi:uncharacterized membrane protein HdeD (DUF308 family)